MEHTRFSVSYHIKDLLKRDVSTIREVCSYLETTVDKQRDRTRRVNSKRMMARLIAAKQLLKAAEGDTQSAESVMNRTEGKVADKLITVDYNDLVRQLEAARQRVLAHQQSLLPVQEQHKQGVLEDQDLDRLHISSYQTSNELTPSAGDGLPVQVSSDVAEEPQPVRDATNPAGSHQGVSSNKLPYSHTRDETVKAEESDQEGISKE